MPICYHFLHVVFNVVPWLLVIPGIFAGKYTAKRLLSDGWTVGQTRKIVEAICMVTEVICMIMIGKHGSCCLCFNLSYG